MKERCTSDTATQSVYMSQVVYSPQYTTVNNAMSGASITSLNTTTQTNYNGSVNYFGQSASISKTLSNLQSGIPVSMKINLLYTNKPLYLTLQQGSTLLYSNTMNSSGTYSFNFTPTQSMVQLSIAYSYFNTNANTLCFTLDSVNYTQQNGSTSSTQLVKISSKQSDKYRFGFNGQEKDNEIAGVGNHNTAEFWEYDTRVGRRWNTDPRPNPSISNYACFANNPIFNIDVKGDTTYRFNKSDGKYLGMFDTDAAGQIGSYGSMKTIGKGKNKQEIWDGQRFEFADPQTDAEQIRGGIINKLIFVSDAEIKGILTGKGAFNYGDKNSFTSFYKKSKGGHPFDYSYSVIPGKYGSQGASSTPLDKSTPSSVLFLPEGDYMAHNHMNFGNYLWAASGYTLGFNFSTLQMAAHANSLINSKSNGYPAQWDSKDDQESIKKGAFHALQFKYRNILEMRSHK